MMPQKWNNPNYKYPLKVRIVDQRGKEHQTTVMQSQIKPKFKIDTSNFKA